MQRHRQVQRLHLEAEVNADCRITCLTLLNPNDFVKKETEEATNETLEKSVTIVDSEANGKQSPSRGLSKKKKKVQNGATSVQSTVVINDKEKVLKKVNHKKKRKLEVLQTVAKQSKVEAVTSESPSSNTNKRLSVKSSISTSKSQRAEQSLSSAAKTNSGSSKVKKSLGVHQRKSSSTSKWSVT